MSSPPGYAPGRKSRGAFFTPPEIATFLTRWAVADDPKSRVLDPTCGEAVFLLAAGRQLQELGASLEEICEQLTGVDLHQPSLDEAGGLLADEGLGARLVRGDFFDLMTPDQIEMGEQLGLQDAVIGNPPFVRYQEHRGEARRRSARAALAQGVRLSGLASSWAALLVHACAFLKPSGRLAMVLPAELLTVHYAEPVRRWLRERFAAVNLVFFEELQFADAEEQVVLVVARGSGGCDAFSLFHVRDSEELAEIHAFDGLGVSPAAEGKWTDLMLPLRTRQLFRRVGRERFSRLDDYGTPELGTVTGANDYFALSEVTRRKYGIPEKHFKRISPPGTRHLKGLSFTRAQWEELRIAGHRVWLLHPDEKARSKGLAAYLARGEEEGVPETYKCNLRTPWWRPPAVPAPDLFFTYMSHRYPRLIANPSKATIVNSMHGVRLKKDAPREAKAALPLLALNSVTMLGAEVLGRSYGGGILKMEPREAASLPVPAADDLRAAWAVLGERRGGLDVALRRGEWWAVVAEVDRVLLRQVMRLNAEDVSALRDAATLLRVRRTRQTERGGTTEA